MDEEQIQSQLTKLAIWEHVFDGILCRRDTVERTHGIRFEIRPKEMGHNTPHCHACFENQNISISLVDFTVLAGNITGNCQRFAIMWVKENAEVLRQHWNKYHCLEV